MEKYLKIKASLEAQGWRVYQKTGDKVYFNKAEVSGIGVVVDASSATAIIESAAPSDYVAKHAPKLTIDKYAAQKRYAQKNKRSFRVECFSSTESDIIEKIESTNNYAGYIKGLIRADIANAENKLK